MSRPRRLNASPVSAVAISRAPSAPSPSAHPPSPRGARDPRRAAALRAVIAATICLQGPARAQEFGQWSWDAAVEMGERRYESQFGASGLSRNSESQIRLGAGLNGFIVHPALARFRLDLDAQATRVEDGSTLDGSRLGFGAEAGFLERGAFPFRFYYRKQIYNYDQVFSDDPFALRSALDSGASWGGSLRIRRGPLDGTLLGAEGNAIDFLDPRARRETNARQYLDWTADGHGFEHHLRVERRARDYGTVDLEQDNLNVNLDERGQLGARWRWDLTGIGGLYRTRLDPRPPVDINDYRLRNHFSGKVREHDLLDIVWGGSLLDPDGAPSQTGQEGSVAYRWRPTSSWELAPEIGYAMLRSDGFETRSPRAGASVTWQGRTESTDALLSVRGAYFLDHRRAPVVEEDVRRSYGASGALGLGSASVLRTEMEFEAGRDELRLDRNPTTSLSGAGVAPAGIGSEDFYRARAGLRRDWDGTGIYGWGEWHRRVASGQVTVPGGRYTIAGVTGAIEFHTYNVGLMGSTGASDVSDAIQGEQRVAYAAANASWRWGRLLTLRASYRHDHRELALWPDVNGRRAESGVTFRLGEYSLAADAYDARDRVEGQSERLSRGVRWTLSTRFAGWLPVVSGAPRRGVIR